MDKSVLKPLCSMLHSGHSLALATIVQQKGSAPRGTGAMMLAYAGGLVAGSVGGGLVEARTLQLCAQVLAQSCPTVLDFHMDAAAAAGSDMICGGAVRVLVEPLLAHSQNAEIFERLYAASPEEQGFLLAALPCVEQNCQQVARTLVLGERVYGAALGEDVWAAVRELSGKTAHAHVLRVSEKEFFVQPVRAPWRLILAGGGHVSRPTAQVAALAGFEVHVLDDRPEYAAATRFPEATLCRVKPEFDDCFPCGSVHERTCIVIMTRGHVHDGHVLRQALQTSASYVGMIGSQRKRQALYAQLQQQGVSEEALAGVHCPVGLAIGAESPEEIAVSIVAQCIAHVRDQNTGADKTL